MSQPIICRKVQRKDFKEWLLMNQELSPLAERKDLIENFDGFFRKRKGAAFVCRSEEGEPAAIANVSFRTDYVEGAHEYPIPYLEGIFVRKEFRGEGVGEYILEIVERWLKGKGYKEIASDTSVKNIQSQKFHKAVGFKKAQESVHYIKPIRRKPKSEM